MNSVLEFVRPAVSLCAIHLFAFLVLDCCHRGEFSVSFRVLRLSTAKQDEKKGYITLTAIRAMHADFPLFRL